MQEAHNPCVDASAAATQASLHHPNADSWHATEVADAVSLHHFYHPKANATKLLLRHHARLNAAVILGGALHMAEGPSASLLHHHHPVQAIRTSMCEEGCDDVLVPETSPVAPPQMMSRGRIPICCIDNLTSRRVTFAKRCNGLLQKACKLSILRDAEVGVIIFSETGRVFEFANNTSMAKLLERYHEHSNIISSRRDPLQDVEFWRCEVLLLRDQLSQLKKFESLLLGENLSPLDLNEIEKVEHRLQIALKKVKFQKKQLLLQTEVQERQRHVARLNEENDLLKRKLSHVSTLARKMPRRDGEMSHMTTSSMHHSKILAGEQECSHAFLTFINHGIDESLKLWLGLRLFEEEFED